MDARHVKVKEGIALDISAYMIHGDATAKADGKRVPHEEGEN